MLSSPVERASAGVWSSLEGEALECGRVLEAAPVSPPSFEGSVVTALGCSEELQALPPHRYPSAHLPGRVRGQDSFLLSLGPADT